MALFSELATKLTLDNKQFLAGLSQSEAAVRGFSATSATALKGVSLLFGGSMLAGVGIFATAITSLTNNIDSLGDTAQNLGIGVEQFQALAYAAEQFGSSTESLTAQLTRMQKKIGDAANGNKSAIEAFERIGLSVKDLIGLSPDEQYKKIAEGVARLGDKTLQTASATEILGKQGGKSLSLLTSNLSEATAKAKDMRQVLGEDQVKTIGELSDRIKELGTAFKTTFGTLLATATPVLNLILDRFNDILNTINSIARVGKNLVGMRMEELGFGSIANYDPNADGKPRYRPTDYSQFDPDNIARRIYGPQFENANIGDSARSGFTDNPIYKVMEASFESLRSSTDRAKDALTDFSSRMEQVASLLINRYDVNRGKPQLESIEFDDIARDLLERQMRGSLDTDYANAKFRELRSITEDNVQLNDKGELQEFSTASLKNDLKQLQDLLLGNKNKNELKITVDASAEFEPKIKKIAENSFTQMLVAEATSTNR